jgi:hypothetical protein
MRQYSFLVRVVIFKIIKESSLYIYFQFLYSVLNNCLRNIGEEYQVANNHFRKHSKKAEVS